MTDIILYGGFRLPAAPGPFANLKVWPPDALDKIVKGFKDRSSGGWLEYSINPEKTTKRIATIRRKLVLHHARRRIDTGAPECKEGIRTESQGRRG